MKKAIGMIGHVGTGMSSVARELAEHKVVVMVDKIPDEKPMIEIGGKMYEQIMHNEIPTKEILDRALNKYSDHVKNRKKRRLPDDLDIVEEYKKIQQKESGLSKWERDEVGLLFMTNFKEIK